MSILITILVAAVVAGIVSAYVAQRAVEEDKKPKRVKKDGAIYGSW